MYKYYILSRFQIRSFWIPRVFHWSSGLTTPPQRIFHLLSHSISQWLFRFNSTRKMIILINFPGNDYDTWLFTIKWFCTRSRATCIHNLFMISVHYSKKENFLYVGSHEKEKMRFFWNAYILIKRQKLCFEPLAWE